MAVCRERIIMFIVNILLFDIIQTIVDCLMQFQKPRTYFHHYYIDIHVTGMTQKKICIVPFLWQSNLHTRARVSKLK